MLIRDGNKQILLENYQLWFEIKVNHVDLGNGKWRWLLSSPPKELCDQLFERTVFPNVSKLHGKVVELPDGGWAILLVENKW